MAIKPNVKIIAIAAIATVILIMGSLLSYWIYVSRMGEQQKPSSNQDVVSLSHQDTSRRGQEVLRKKVEEDLNKKYNSVDSLIEAFTKYENSKEVDVNSLEGDKKITMQAVGGMSNGTLKKLKTVAEGKQVTMSQNDCESLKNFITGAKIDEALKQTLIENLENNVTIISETSPIDTSTPEAIEKLKTVELGKDFLDAINTIGYQVDINDHLIKLDKFANVPLDVIIKLYAPDTDIVNAKKLHLIAKDLVNVIKHCKDQEPKTLTPNDPMLGKLNKAEVKAYLKDVDYQKFLVTFRTASDGPTGPTGIEKLKNFKPGDGCLPYSPDLLANLKVACDDNSAKANNPHLATLCGLQNELQTLHVLIEGKATRTDDFEQLEHLLRLRQNNAFLCPDQVDELLDESKKKIIADYLDIAKVEDVNNPPAIDIVRLRDAGKKLLLLLPHLQTTAKLTVEQRIIDLRDNDQLVTVDKLIIKDLSNLLQDLYHKLKAPLADTSKLDAQITKVFEAIQAIDSSISAITKAQYLKNLDATWKFEEAMKVVIAELKAKIIDLNWKFATGLDPFKDKIEELISAFDEAQKVVPTYNCNEIKKPWKETFKALVKSNIVSELIERLKSEPLAITTKSNEWATLVQEIHKIDPTHPGLFEEVKSLTKVTDGASLISWITLKKSNNYEAIVKRNFSTQHLDLSADIDLIRYLRTIVGNPLLIDMLKSDAIADPSLTILTGIINIIDKIEAASIAINDSASSRTLNLAQRQAMVAIHDRTDLIVPFTLKPLKDNIKPIIADFMAGIQALHVDNTAVVNVDKCRKAADKLILFKTIDNISDMPSLPLSGGELKAVDLLLMGTYDTGSKFIQDFFQHALTEIPDENTAKSIYKIYSIFNNDNGPFDWGKLDVGKYKGEKDAHLSAIANSLLIIDPSQVTENLLNSHVPYLINLRNNLIYSFDPVDPAFERNQLPDDVKAKILAHFHTPIMDLLISKKSACALDLYDETKAVIKDTLKFLSEYFGLSPKFKESMPSDITGIINGNALKNFFEVHLPAADKQFDACIKTAIKGKLRTVILTEYSPITEEGIPAINDCIKRRLQYGSVLPTSNFQRIAIKYEEKKEFVRNAAILLVEEEVKSISEDLAIQLLDTEDNELMLKSEYELLKKIEIFAGTCKYPTLYSLYGKCYDKTWEIIGEAITTKTTQDEIAASISKVNNFKKLPNLELIKPQVLHRAELMSDILPDFKIAAQDDNVSANVRSKQTFSDALSESGAVADKVKDFWKYKLAIWYLGNRSYYSDVEKILNAARKVLESSNVSGFESQVLAMRDVTSTPPTWIITNDNIIFPNGKPITNALLFDLLNALVYDYLDNNGSNPFFKEDLQQFITELIKNETIDVVKDAVLLTDGQRELISLANKGHITKSSWDLYAGSDMSKSTNEFRTLAEECIKNSHVKELKRFLTKKFLYLYEPEYKRRIIELTRMELEQDLKSKLDEIDNSLKNEPRFQELFDSFVNPGPNLPDVIGAFQLLAKYKDTTAVDRRKEFWKLFEQFMTVSIKFNASKIESSSILAFHQHVLTELKRIELFNAIQPPGGGSKNLILGENYDVVKNQIIPSSTTTTTTPEEIRYLTFLKLIADLKDETIFNSSPNTVSVYGIAFLKSFAIDYFKFTVEANGVGDNEFIVLKSWVAKRKELFGIGGSDSGVNFIDDPVQNSVNEVLDLHVDYGKAKLDTINAAVNGPIVKARAVLSSISLDDFIILRNDINSKPWMDDFVDKLLATGKLHQKYLNALHQLVVNIDDIDPVLDAKFATLIPESSNFFELSRRAYVLHNILKYEASLTLVATSASDKDRINHCYLNGIPQLARRLLDDQTYIDLNYMLEKAKQFKDKGDKPLPHENQRQHANLFMQYYRLWDLFDALQMPSIIRQTSPGADGLLDFEVEPLTGNAIRDEIMSVPIIVDNQLLRHDIASLIDASKSLNENKESIKTMIEKEFELIHTKCHELLAEEAVRMMKIYWKVTSIESEP